MNALADPDGRPVDLAAVQADDALLDRLTEVDLGTCDVCGVPLRYVFGVGTLVDGDCHHPISVDVVDAAVRAALVAWRRDVDTEAIPVLVDADTAVAVIEVNREPEPRRCSALGVVAAVLAVLIVVFCALGLMALHAHSGGLLWLLHQFLYSTGGVR